MKKNSSRVLWLFIAVLMWLLPAGLLSASAQEKPVARFLLFYGETCPHCHEIMSGYLPTVYEKYGDQVEHRDLETFAHPTNSEIFHGLLRKLDVRPDKQGYVPTLIIGDKVMIGNDEIQALLEVYIDQYLALGGVDYPPLENLPDPVEILIFFDPNDTATVTKLQVMVAPLGEKYGRWIQFLGADMSQLVEYNAALGIPQPPQGTPQVLVGRQMLIGLEEIESQLPRLIETYKARGGARVPTLAELTGKNPTATPVPSPETATPAASKPIYVAYFDQAGCQECARTTDELRRVKAEYPQLVVETYPIEDHKTLNEWLSQKFNVPEEKRLATPMVFIGSDVLIGGEANLNNLMLLAAKYAATGAERTWDDFDEQVAAESLVDRFRSFGVLTVLGAGLIDGLNPCAFATLVFFISYLTFTGRRGRDVLFVGASFTLGVFLTYLLVGVGLLRAVQSLSFFTALGKWVYLITALLCMLLAALTFRDFSKARKGLVTEMTLRLPLSLRRRIHTVIREGAQVRAFVAMAFVTGFIVSLIELACTGQVYLPTIMFVLSVPELATRAFLSLLLYCLMFITPLVVVFGLSYFGTTSEQLGQFVNRHTATIKFLTGLVFVGLALWMTSTLAPLFGAVAPWNWVLMGASAVVIVAGTAALHLVGKSTVPKPKQRRRQKSA